MNCGVLSSPLHGCQYGPHRLCRRPGSRIVPVGTHDKHSVAIGDHWGGGNWQGSGGRRRRYVPALSFRRAIQRIREVLQLARADGRLQVLCELEGKAAHATVELGRHSGTTATNERPEDERSDHIHCPGLKNRFKKQNLAVTR